MNIIRSGVLNWSQEFRILQTNESFVSNPVKSNAAILLFCNAAMLIELI
ncbi:MAG: hypothetical protein IPG95_05415 [Saprospiraceae bacterium]|nr:hypothetical protein [Saprospiraceae bacterium]